MVVVDNIRKAQTLNPKIQERTLGETLSFLLVAAVTCTVLEHLSLCLQEFWRPRDGGGGGLISFYLT